MVASETVPEMHYFFFASLIGAQAVSVVRAFLGACSVMFCILMSAVACTAFDVVHSVSLLLKVCLVYRGSWCWWRGQGLQYPTMPYL